VSLRTIGYQEIFAKAISRLNRRRENGSSKKGNEKFGNEMVGGINLLIIET
jgi:hypothetical protein